MGVSLWQRLASQYAVLYNFLLNLKTQLESNSGGRELVINHELAMRVAGSRFSFQHRSGKPVSLHIYIYSFIYLCSSLVYNLHFI